MIEVMIILLNILVFAFGLCVGSFLNVIIYRLPKKLDVVWGRSFCPNCKKKINWFDNIPLFSFLVLRGHCRYCKSPISWRYPLVELITGVLTILIFNQFSLLRQGFGGQAIFNLICFLILAWALIAIFFIDFEHQIIPDKIIIPVTILFLLRTVITGEYLRLLPALFSFLFLFLVWFFTKGKGMGFGDVKLAFLMGLALGFPGVVIAFYIAFLTGAFIGVILILGKRVKFKQKIAFGPFLALGTIISCLWGQNIINFFLKLLS